MRMAAFLTDVATVLGVLQSGTLKLLGEQQTHQAIRQIFEDLDFLPFGMQLVVRRLGLLEGDDHQPL